MGLLMSLVKGILTLIINKAIPLGGLQLLLRVRTLIKSRKIVRPADITRNLHETLNQLPLFLLLGKQIQ